MISTICCFALLLEPQDKPKALAPQATSLLGKPLISPPPGKALLQRFRKHKAAHKADPGDIDKLIWFGRFVAYKGNYRDAINVYSRGIKQAPNDARLYRHRAHRFITLREFDRAIADMQVAVRLIDGKLNEVEPDGMPNAKNIPVSTLHGNIYYHLGLAHYLQGDFPKALAAYRRCLELKTNDDNTVSATHWVYMILRRMGRDNEARAVLRGIREDMNVIENHSYHRACLLYKGLLSLKEINKANGDSPSDDALKYAIGNWHLCNGRTEAATKTFKQIVAGKTWQSFGHIAAEAELVRMRPDGRARAVSPQTAESKPPQTQLADAGQRSFFDTFQPTSAHWFFNEEWSVENGSLVRHKTGSENSRIFLRETELQDAVVAFDFRLGASQDIRFVTGSGGSYNAVIHIRPDHFFVQTAQDKSGPWFSQRQGDCAFRFEPDRWYTMTVEFLGDELVASVDENHLVYAKHPMLAKTRRYFAFQVDQHSATFDNVRIHAARLPGNASRRRQRVQEFATASPANLTLAERLQIEERNAHARLHMSDQPYRDVVAEIDRRDAKLKERFPEVFRSHKEIRKKLAAERKRLLTEDATYKEMLFATHRAKRAAEAYLVEQNPSVATLPDSRKKHAMRALRGRFANDAGYLERVRNATEADEALQAAYPQLFVSDVEINAKRKKLRDAVQQNPEFRELTKARADVWARQIEMRKERDQTFAAVSRKAQEIATVPTLQIVPIPRHLRPFRSAFSKYTSVFGVHVIGTQSTPDSKLQHIAGVLAQYLDNDEDGKPENHRLVETLVLRDAYMVVASTEREFERLGPEAWVEAGFHAGQAQWATETKPTGNRFDATLEEVFHLITHHGYATAYPEVFGTEPGTRIADCLDAARSGRFEEVPRHYPAEAWFTYDDDTCEYECQITEYIYWAMTSFLGAQAAPQRQREIAHEWRLPTRELMQKGDPRVVRLLTDRRYGFPTKLPDGNYRGLANKSDH